MSSDAHQILDMRLSKCLERRIDAVSDVLKARVFAQLAIPEEGRVSSLNLPDDCDPHFEFYDCYLEGLNSVGNQNMAGLCGMCRDAQVPFQWFWQLARAIQTLEAAARKAGWLLARFFLLFPPVFRPVVEWRIPPDEAPKYPPPRRRKNVPRGPPLFA